MTPRHQQLSDVPSSAAAVVAVQATVQVVEKLGKMGPSTWSIHNNVFVAQYSKAACLSDWPENPLKSAQLGSLTQCQICATWYTLWCRMVTQVWFVWRVCFKRWCPFFRCCRRCCPSHSGSGGTRQKGLQIILLTNVIHACLPPLFLFPRGAINAAAEQSDHPQKGEEKKLQCSLVNCLRWSAVKMC